MKNILLLLAQMLTFAFKNQKYCQSCPAVGQHFWLTINEANTLEAIAKKGSSRYFGYGWDYQPETDGVSIRQFTLIESLSDDLAGVIADIHRAGFKVPRAEWLDAFSQIFLPRENGFIAVADPSFIGYNGRCYPIVGRGHNISFVAVSDNRHNQKSIDNRHHQKLWLAEVPQTSKTRVST